MKIKLVGFDWDGTLTKLHTPSSWKVLNKELGCEKEDDPLYEEFYKGRLAYDEWCRKTTELYKKHGLNEKLLRKIVIKEIKPMNGAIETIEKLKEKGIKIAIISGSIGNIYDIISEKYGVAADFVSFASRFNFNSGGELVGGEFNEYDFEGKAEKLKEFCQKVGITLKEAAYIGDHDNDIPVFKVCYGIAFVPNSEELRKFSKAIVEKEDMREILKYIEV